MLLEDSTMCFCIIKKLTAVRRSRSEYNFSATKCAKQESGRNPGVPAVPVAHPEIDYSKRRFLKANNTTLKTQATLSDILLHLDVVESRLLVETDQDNDFVAVVL